MRKLLNLLPFKRARLERDLDREIQYHLDRRIADLIATGLTAGEARREALLEFGGVSRIEEEVRDAWFWRWLFDIARDLRYAVRVASSSPAFAITAIVSIALGIGANTAIFSILHALVLRSLPVSDPERLVVITRDGNSSSPYFLFREYQNQTRTLQGVLAFANAPVRMSKDGETERIDGTLVSGSYFDVLGVRPQIGSTITNDDDRIPGAGGSRGAVAVLSHGYWIRRFGGEPSAIGTRVLLNDHPFTVIGVAPAGFNGAEIGKPPDIFAPMSMQQTFIPEFGDALAQRGSQWIRVFGRLRPDVDRRQSEAELTTILRRYNDGLLRSGDITGEITDPLRRQTLRQEKAKLQPGAAGISQLRSRYQKPLWVLMTVTGLVLLIACANVANLFLSRATARRREIAIRLSLGAARSRLISQLFTESLLLATVGAASGICLAVWLRNILIRFLPADRTLNAPLDTDVMLFTVALSVGSAILFGLLPAFQSSRVDVAPALKGEATAAKPVRFLVRKGLVVFQTGLSLLLLIGASLFLRSLHNLLIIDPGFVRQNIVIASVQGDVTLYSRLNDQARYLPGVISAAVADSSPLEANIEWQVYSDAKQSGQWCSVAMISPSYFATLGIARLLGRDIDSRDVSERRDIMVVNEAFARYYLAGRDPIGQRVGLSAGLYSWEIVGVVKDGRYKGLRESTTRMAYVPYRPGPWASHMTVHLRTAADPIALTTALRQKVHELDKAATVFDVHTIEQEVDRSLLRERLVGTITALFAGLALVLAATGLYGLTAYGVARRTSEFGVRIAVGARPGQIASLVLHESFWLLAAGTLMGLAAAWAFGRVVKSLLYNIEPADPLAALIAILTLIAVALIAAWLPARRASKVDPTRALRYE